MSLNAEAELGGKELWPTRPSYFYLRWLSAAWKQLNTLSFQKSSPQMISITPVIGGSVSLSKWHVSLRRLLLFSCVLQTEEPHYHWGGKLETSLSSSSAPNAFITKSHHLHFFNIFSPKLIQGRSFLISGCWISCSGDRSNHLSAPWLQLSFPSSPVSTLEPDGLYNTRIFDRVTPCPN